MKESPFLDKHDEVEFHFGGNLPHLHQDGTLQFVTFRLCDSLPVQKCTRLQDAVTDFKTKHPEPWDSLTRSLYRKLISPIEEQLLDNGYGSCILRNPLVRKIVIDSLLYFNDSKYRIIGYVIMPNHVHLLLYTHGDNKLSKILQSLKGFTARKINDILNTQGSIWMKESFDRAIRNKEHLENCIDYIRKNPTHLQQGEFDIFIDTVYLNSIL